MTNKTLEEEYPYLCAVADGFLTPYGNLDIALAVELELQKLQPGRAAKPPTTQEMVKLIVGFDENNVRSSIKQLLQKAGRYYHGG